MPGWQEFYEKHKNNNFEILSVAVDVQGMKVAKPFTEGTTFRTLADPDNKLANHFNFSIVPNGIFVDEDGTIRLIKQGFHNHKGEHIEAVEKLIQGKAKIVELDDKYYEPPSHSDLLQKQLAQTKFRLGMEYLRQDRKEEALKELDEALLLDSDNFLIRKQRWYIRYPEKFSPTIDIKWQQQQLEKERQEEAEQTGMVCGPEGCYIPGTEFKK
ncbi:thioredoxin family protein [Piscibacillus halophilus]|nr:thioredoxin family protein [Piscibacillus halophilus]